MRALLNKALQQNNMSVSDTQLNQLVHYLELMQKWNRAFNLTTITEPQDMVYLHIVDSLAVQPFLYGTRMLDVGSGAGLPGIPLAIINPEQQWTLLDKNSKKTRFLTQVIAELGLKNVQTAHSRSEEYKSNACFDSILSRAFGTLTMFTETTQHLLCENGFFIAMKGKYPQDELDDLPAHIKTETITQLDIKGIQIDRHIICLRMNH